MFFCTSDSGGVIKPQHGRPIVLAIATGRMHEDGHIFWQADNGVWLTDVVAPAYLAFHVDAPPVLKSAATDVTLYTTVDIGSNQDGGRSCK